MTECCVTLSKSSNLSVCTSVKWGENRTHVIRLLCGLSKTHRTFSIVLGKFLVHNLRKINSSIRAWKLLPPGTSHRIAGESPTHSTWCSNPSFQQPVQVASQRWGPVKDGGLHCSTWGSPAQPAEGAAPVFAASWHIYNDPKGTLSEGAADGSTQGSPFPAFSLSP